jgi:lipoate-protein ligase A
MHGDWPDTAYPQADWRLLVDGETDGATNMAVDEAIHSAVVECLSPPTLRFRATGDVVVSYRRLSEGLLAGLQSLGAELVQATRQGKPSPDLTAVCFETPSDYEITAGGRKLVGSAQWRARGGVLQHGTLPLSGDLTRIVDYLSFSDAERAVQRQALRARAITLEDALGRSVSFALAAQALAEGFTRALNVNPIPGELMPHECDLAAELRFSRYAASEWTNRA